MITVILWESVSKDRNCRLRPVRLNDSCHGILCGAAVPSAETGSVQYRTDSEISDLSHEKNEKQDGSVVEINKRIACKLFK